MVTIKEVAAHAGVSPSTVTKVLKNYPQISQETKEKVHKSVNELGYVANAYASMLSSKSHNKIALVVNVNNSRQSIDEINMLYILGGISKAKELGMDIITIFSTSLEDMSYEEIVRYFKSQLITGLIFYGLSKEHVVYHKIIKEEIFDVVGVDADIVNTRTSAVCVDHFHGQYEVAKKLITENNAKKILYIAGNMNGYVTDIRLKAMRQLARDLKLDVQYEYGIFSEKKAKQITNTYAKNCDVIVCASDLMAIGAIKELERMDIYRPVSGYDGITLTGYIADGMYTVKQDFYNVSQEAITEMQNLIEKKPTRLVLLPHKIICVKYEDIIT